MFYIKFCYIMFILMVIVAISSLVKGEITGVIFACAGSALWWYNARKEHKG